jgi:hypothetical protein
MKCIYIIELTLYYYLKIKHNLLRYKRDLFTTGRASKVTKVTRASSVAKVAARVVKWGSINLRLSSFRWLNSLGNRWVDSRPTSGRLSLTRYSYVAFHLCMWKGSENPHSSNTPIIVDKHSQVMVDSTLAFLCRIISMLKFVWKSL